MGQLWSRRVPAPFAAEGDALQGAANAAREAELHAQELADASDLPGTHSRHRVLAKLPVKLL